MIVKVVSIGWRPQRACWSGGMIPVGTGFKAYNVCPFNVSYTSNMFLAIFCWNKNPIRNILQYQGLRRADKQNPLKLLSHIRKNLRIGYMAFGMHSSALSQSPQSRFLINTLIVHSYYLNNTRKSNLYWFPKPSLCGLTCLFFIMHLLVSLQIRRHLPIQFYFHVK